jgi:hypothetical protein
VVLSRIEGQGCGGSNLLTVLLQLQVLPPSCQGQRCGPELPPPVGARPEGMGLQVVQSRRGTQ